MLRILDELQEEKSVISSKELSNYINATPYSIRKDINMLENINASKNGYEIKNLIFQIKDKLKIKVQKRAGIAGLGRIGTAILNYQDSRIKGYDIVAGFDSNLNKLESMHTAISLYPSYDIEDIVKEQSIKIAVIAVPVQNAQEIANRFINGGVEGIINFAPVIIKTGNKKICVRNIDLVTEFNFLTSVI